MQTSLSESLTQLQRGEDGLYGRRTGSKHVVHDVFVLPHVFGSLTLHKEGFAVILQHQSLATLIEVGVFCAFSSFFSFWCSCFLCFSFYKRHRFPLIVVPG